MTDSGTIQYLSKYDDEINERALEALKIGTIVIQSAIPEIDTRLVEQRFDNLAKKMDECMTEFNSDISYELDQLFDDDDGKLNKSLDGFLGNEGILSRLLYQYFGSDGGHLLTLLNRNLGPGSEFSKHLDPDNKESVIYKIEKTVKSYMQDHSKEILNQFSLDVEDSAISKLKKSIMTEMHNLREYNGQFFTELKAALGFELGKNEEALKGTEKGREFEVSLYEHVAQIGRNFADQTDIVRSIVGSVPYSKKGDYTITLGETSGAPDLNIVVEVKKEHGYRLKDAVKELKEAKKNREANVGIFVFAESCAPVEVGNFLRIGNDFYVTVNDEDLSNPSSIIYFKAAYNILRTIIVSISRMEKSDKIDIERVKAEIDSSVETVGRMVDLITKARTIKNSSNKIESLAGDIMSELQERLDIILNIINNKGGK
ncbi:MAG: hypothetical protein H8E55_66150 [Pelagibacterales bacterium]|nr:hypothetical protein [Pelagibacterales bacterium]